MENNAHNQHYALNQLAYLATHPWVTRVEIHGNVLKMFFGESSANVGAFVQYTVNDDGTIVVYDPECSAGEFRTFSSFHEALLDTDLLDKVWFDNHGKVLGILWKTVEVNE